MPRDARFGVFEMGMNHAGELAALTRLVRPHVAIVTTIAPGAPRVLRQRRRDRRRQGRDLPGAGARRHRDHPLDSPHRDRLIAAARPHAARIVTFGLGEGADVRAAYVVRGPARRIDGDRAAAGRAAELTPSRSRASIGWPMRWPCWPRSRRWAAISRWPGSRSPSWAGSRGAARGTGSRPAAARRC